MRARKSRVHLAGAIIAAALVHVSGQSRASPQATPEASFPSLLNTYITTYVRLTPAERSALLANRPVTKLLDAEPNKEISVFGAVWIDALPGAYVRLVNGTNRRQGPTRWHSSAESFMSTSWIRRGRK